MAEAPITENDFLAKITAIIEENISNEQFGVSELADAMNMSRSNLLRKVKKETKLSVSQLISQVRLKRAMELLRTSSMNVSEVSHQVGFNSTSYFIKCFREYYGYPPGEVGKRDEADPVDLKPQRAGKRKVTVIAIAITTLVLLAVAMFAYFEISQSGETVEKSIAVLPFKNDSSDSSNVYFINGLMESTLSSLQKIKDLKVISRTSAEKYRNTTKSIPEMASELNVSYFVAGSGQKIGDQILLNIQLIEASTDRHLWAKQYKREVKDIFELQAEIAGNIADEIKVIITPEEEKRIKKKPTDDLVAYDYFLKAEDLFHKGGQQNLESAIVWFNKATEKDPEFALAHAGAAIVYYYLDLFHTNKKYGNEINATAEQAFLFDPKLGESLVAKALSYIHKKEYDRAVPYLEKALEYNPNSVMVIHFLSEFYNIHMPNTGKYLEYALKGIRLDIASQDSTTTSYTYLHLANALIQTGFIDEALLYINRSLDYNPNNPFSGYVKPYILYAKDRNIKRTRDLLIRELNKDTTRIDITQEVAKVCFLMGDYDSAYLYYQKFIKLRDAARLDIFKHEHLKIATVFAKRGDHAKAEEYLNSYKQFADQDRSIYKNLHLAGYYCHVKQVDKAMEHLKLFSKEDNYQYWILLINEDPEVEKIRDHPDFPKVMKVIETKFWDNHKKIKASLEEKDLL
jgi:TolB-like protein/AraC-like DNA-binding protein